VVRHRADLAQRLGRIERQNGRSPNSSCNRGLPSSTPARSGLCSACRDAAHRFGTGPARSRSTRCPHRGGLPDSNRDDFPRYLFFEQQRAVEVGKLNHVDFQRNCAHRFSERKTSEPLAQEQREMLGSREGRPGRWRSRSRPVAMPEPQDKR
jgi:hypothetical protein